MAGLQDFQECVDDFVGANVALPTSANVGSPWVATIVGTGPPTQARNAGELILTLQATSQAQVVSITHGDALAFDITKLIGVEFFARLGAATFASGSVLSFGVGSARNNDIAEITARALFRMTGATSTTGVQVESRTASVHRDNIASGQTLADKYKRFYIDFSGGTKDVKFYIDGVRVAPGTQFDMSAYTGNVQPIMQLQKATGATVDAVRFDYVRVLSRRH